MLRKSQIAAVITFLGSAALAGAQTAAPHVIELTADKDSRYRVAGKANPTITMKAGEPVHLRITATRAKTWNRDGSVHGFALVHAGDQKRVEGWNLSLRPGLNEFDLSAPSEPGNYVVVCTVICSDAHEGMTMKVVVTP
jgi:heme/copper-type cytochrome/quinol oxidase subunit 2